MIARGLEASILCANDAGAKPPKTTVWIAPRREIASIAKSAEGIMGTVRCQHALHRGWGHILYTSTTSPFRTPSSLNTPASVSTSCNSWLYVYFSLLLVTGESHMIAVEFPFPFLTCLSMQVYDVDISPSGNQVKLGCEMPLESFLVSRVKAREGFLCQ